MFENIKFNDVTEILIGTTESIIGPRPIMLVRKNDTGNRLFKADLVGYVEKDAFPAHSYSVCVSDYRVYEKTLATDYQVKITKRWRNLNNKYADLVKTVYEAHRDAYFEASRNSETEAC